MADPFEFILRESAVTSSQEERLQLVLGWEEHQDAGSPSPSSVPSQAPLALSRLGASGSSDEEEHEPEQAAVFSVQEPSDCESPEPYQEDSYNAAFESDRSRSLSPLAPLQVYGDWASRPITQSQNDFGTAHFRVCDLPLAEEASQGQACREGKHSHWLQGTDGHAQSSNAVDAFVVTHSRMPSRDILNGPSVHVDHLKNCHKADTLDGNACVHNIVEQVKPVCADQLPSPFNITSRKRCLDAAVDESTMEEATLRVKAGSLDDGAENSAKQKAEEGDCTFAMTTPMLREPNHEQQHEKLANEANYHKAKNPQQLADGYVAGSSKTKCLLSIVSEKGNISTRRRGKAICDEAGMVHDHVTIDDMVTRVFPESVMDAVMLLSETAPSSSSHDPDFLSIVMSTGVSLSLPYRDCSGGLISGKLISTYKGSFSSGPT